MGCVGCPSSRSDSGVPTAAWSQGARGGGPSCQAPFGVQHDLPRCGLVPCLAAGLCFCRHKLWSWQGGVSRGLGTPPSRARPTVSSAGSAAGGPLPAERPSPPRPGPRRAAWRTAAAARRLGARAQLVVQGPRQTLGHRPVGAAWAVPPPARPTCVPGSPSARGPQGQFPRPRFSPAPLTFCFVFPALGRAWVPCTSSVRDHGQGRVPAHTPRSSSALKLLMNRSFEVRNTSYGITCRSLPFDSLRSLELRSHPKHTNVGLLF